MLRSLLRRFGRKTQDKAALRIALCEDRIFVSDHQEISLDRAEGAPSWRAAMDALPPVLKAFPGREANIVLADQFVRYALLPWSDTLKTHAQWLALAAESNLRPRIAARVGALARRGRHADGR